ncbi:MAG TPA: endonuclease/exonuclease/phosphatase family protein [Gammaproteobacteria bacterium]|nr:endonuclease/exonuclease/phosphatase family protein [Gammaproteobacteria bacterium]
MILRMALPAMAALLLLWALPAPAGAPADAPVRFATFNASLSRSQAGALIADLRRADDAQAQAVAAIIQRVDPDVLLLNEFDYDPAGEALALFQRRYLGVAQGDAPAVTYPYVYVGPSNTGVPSGRDLDNDGSVGGPNDAYGFGLFPGQYGMAVLSKYPILTRQVRTFRHFRWQDMPGALLPDDPATPAPLDWYSAEELAELRLSSKSHWDVPVWIDGRVVHVLASHPTPPVFDGAEDRNGRRNHDEIRFWADFVSPGRAAGYVYDDAGRRGGLRPGAAFVILGDLNADPYDGDSTGRPVWRLLNHPRVTAAPTPGSAGAIEATARQGGVNAVQLGDPRLDTADFADGEGAAGNLRVDYVLPSRDLRIAAAGVFWPTAADPLFALVGDYPFASSDHRLVWADLAPCPLACQLRATVGD